jgi:hypothetical protein
MEKQKKKPRRLKKQQVKKLCKRIDLEDLKKCSDCDFLFKSICQFYNMPRHKTETKCCNFKEKTK